MRAFLLAGVALATLFAAAPSARARAGDAGDTRHAVRLASPAVVRIVGAASGRVICHGCAGGQTVVEPANGGAYQFAFGGSGAFISPDGYIMTADHVVDTDEIRYSFIDTAITDFAAQQGISQDAATQIFERADADGRLDASSVHVSEQRVFLSTAYTGPLQSVSQVVSYPIQRIAASSPTDKQDTAIIKVDVQDMPFLQLASANEVRVQDAVTAVAYPGDADPNSNNDGNTFDLLLRPSAASVQVLNNLLTPTVETGSIIAQKTVADNTAAYETTGIANHGSSGGAVINGDGKIAGFVDRFSSTDSDRVTILVASSVVSQYATQSGVPAAPQGTFMTQWSKAIGEYDATGPCHFTNAARDFQRLQGAYPAFGGVSQFEQDAQAKATAAECPVASGGARAGLLVGALAGGLALLVLVVGIVLAVTLARRRGRAGRSPALVGAAAMGGYGMPAMPSVPLMGQSGMGYPGYPSQALPPAYPGASYPQGAPGPYGPMTYPGQYQAQPSPYGSPSDAMPNYGAPGPMSSYGSAVNSAYTGSQAGQSGSQPWGNAQPQASQYPQPSGPSSPSWAPQQTTPTTGQGARICVNGHLVQELDSQFCPFCGAPVGHAR